MNYCKKEKELKIRYEKIIQVCKKEKIGVNILSTKYPHQFYYNSFEVNHYFRINVRSDMLWPHESSLGIYLLPQIPHPRLLKQNLLFHYFSL